MRTRPASPRCAMRATARRCRSRPR
jgi:hypothetical protein